MRYIVFLLLFIHVDIVKAELPSVAEKTTELRKLLINKNFKDLSFYLDDYLSARTVSDDGAHYLTAILEGFFSKKASSVELDILNQWVEDDDTSVWARLLRTYYYLNQLDRFPSRAFAKKDRFLQELIAQAAEDSEMAVRLARDNICARYAHLKIARYQAYKHDYQKRFQVLQKLNPQYFQAYLERLVQLSPQWGGTTRDLMNFSKQTAAAYDDKSVLKCLPLYAHKLMAESSKDPEKYLSKKNVLEDIQNAERLVSQAYPRSSKYLRLFSKLAKQGGYQDLAERALRQAEDRERLLIQPVF